mgnify:CR=1 FL=1
MRSDLVEPREDEAVDLTTVLVVLGVDDVKLRQSPLPRRPLARRPLRRGGV